MQKYIDSHCHLPKNMSFEQAFEKANSVGIVGCVLNSVSESDWPRIIDISKHNKNVACCIGIHPWCIDSATVNWMHNMDAILQDNPHIMIGEVGLDKTHDNFVNQERIFTRSVELAIRYNRVLNLHCVHAWDSVLKILKMYKNNLPKIVVHAFDGTQNALDFDENLYFSYSPNIAKVNYKKIKLSLCKVPKNKILLESDSDDFLPVLTAANAVLDARPDVSADDIFNNTMGVFFNG